MGRVTPDPSIFSIAQSYCAGAWNAEPRTARCEYCGRYGSLGSCDGCGAPNKPVWAEQRTRIEVTRHGDRERKFADGLPMLPLGVVIR